MNIPINGKQIPLFFGLHVFESIQQYVIDKGDMSHAGFLSILITSAHENHCLTFRPPLPFVTNYNEVRQHIESNFIDDAFSDICVKVLEEYNNSVPKKMVDKINESAGKAEKKRKVTPTGRK